MYRKIWETNDKEDKDKNIKMGVTLAWQCDVDVRTVRKSNGQRLADENRAG